MKKYLMGFDLKEIYRINHLRNIKLSLKHLVILKWLVDFLGTNRMETKMINDNVWYWCSYKKIIEDLPILEITNKEVISRLIKDLVKANLLELYIDKKIGNKTYLRLGNEYTNLISSDEELQNKPDDFNTKTYKHKKKKSKKSINSKVDRVSTKKSIPLSTKKSNNRLVINIDKLNKITTTNIDTVNKIEPTTSEPKKTSSSFSIEKIKEIKMFLVNSVKDIATCKNIMEAVTNKNLDIARIQEVINYALKNNKGNGYIVQALKNNWEIPSTNKLVSTKPKQNMKAMEEYKAMTTEFSNSLIENDELDKFMETLLPEQQEYVNECAYKLALEKCGGISKIAQSLARRSTKYEILKRYKAEIAC